ncbi:MAG: DNA-binding response regulator [Clostridiales bacterium]|nr:DNA-binding response regulator [Clostridiales bacterium]
MNLKIGICDDDPAQVTLTETLTASWAKENGHSIKIKTYKDAESFLFDFEEENDFDILLLDIEMGDMNGVTLAKNIRKKGETVQIIFITGYSDYISDGYDVAALHYLMKPLKAEKLFEVLNRAAVKIKKDEKTLTVRTEEETFRIPIREIKYIDVCKNDITIHAKRDITVRKTLSEIEKELDGRFFRTGRQSIINLDYVRRTTKNSVTLAGGEEIPLPRGAYEAINRAIIEMN